MSEALENFPYWPDIPPLYDIHRTWKENIEAGPRFRKPYPERPEGPMESFLGFSLRSTLGVAAGPLLDSRWIHCASRLGFDILTYKTISAQPRASHPLPNIVYLDIDGQLSNTPDPLHVTRADIPPTYIEQLAITNSFGNPSMDSSFLRDDIARARACLLDGQMLVVSVFGTGESPDALADAYCEAAHIALQGGAHAIEANLSCPNVKASEGALYQSPTAVLALSSALHREIGSAPLILKMGAFADCQVHREVFAAAVEGSAQAISGINTLQREIRTSEGDFALGSQRPTGGVCGNPIRAAALDFIAQSRHIIRSEKLPLSLIGVGGMTLPEHFDAALDAGADSVQCATGMMWDPYLAARYHQRKEALDYV